MLWQAFYFFFTIFLIDRQRNNVIELNSRSQLLCVVRWNVEIEFLKFFFLLSRVCFSFQVVSCRQTTSKFFSVYVFLSFVVVSFSLLLFLVFMIKENITLNLHTWKVIEKVGVMVKNSKILCILLHWILWPFNYEAWKIYELRFS